jgi:hypothetical protein
MYAQCVVIWTQVAGTFFGEDRLFVKCPECQGLSPKGVKSHDAELCVCTICGEVMVVK